MAESDFQRIPLAYAVDALDLHFETRPEIYVTGNIFLYYQEGHPEDVIAPDVFVVFGVEKRLRRSYKVWEEGGRTPDFVLEITSETTRHQDQGPKWGLYAYLGVREYFQFDPTGDYLQPVIQGWRLDSGLYRKLPTQALNGTLSLSSEVLGLEMRVDLMTGQMRFYDPKTGQRLLSRKESETARLETQQALRVAEARADHEAQARQVAEARVAQEAAARQSLEVELERLRAELARLKS